MTLAWLAHVWAWLLQVLIALDQLANAFIPGGWADETLSSRAHRMRAKRQRVWGWLAGFIDVIFFLQRRPAHCERAYISEAERLQLPPELRGTPAAPTVDWPMARPMRQPTAQPYYPPGTDPDHP